MRLPHHPDALDRLRVPSEDEPLRVLVSACLLGHGCTTDGTDSGMGQALGDLLSLPTLRVIPFCPEHHGIGTPRGMPDIHGGDGYDVLEGRARVYDEHGEDLTAGMLEGAEAMLATARAHTAELAILVDMSASCGSQVISDGCRLVPDRRYRAGVGVATALLLRHGIPVVSQRDHRTLQRLRARWQPGFVVDPAVRDHHESDWFRGHFRDGG